MMRKLRKFTVKIYYESGLEAAWEALRAKIRPPRVIKDIIYSNRATEQHKTKKFPAV